MELVKTGKKPINWVWKKLTNITLTIANKIDI